LLVFIHFSEKYGTILTKAVQVI